MKRRRKFVNGGTVVCGCDSSGGWFVLKVVVSAGIEGSSSAEE